VDNGPVSTYKFTGSLPKCNSTSVTLNAVTSSPGQHILTIFSSNPNGVADQFTGNDTARKTIEISPTVPAPVPEGFEETTFPPLNWIVLNPDGNLTWERTTAAAKTGVASMVIRNYDYHDTNTIDKFISPVITFDPAVDSFFVSFDYAYALGPTYAGSSSAPYDTLDIQITQDCGHTFTSVFKKWGGDLQTPNTLGISTATGFVPNANQWQNITIYLSPVIGKQNFQVYFVDRGNGQNNLYIDNINIYTKTLPKTLKEQGYLIYPSPFRNTFIIRNLTVPTTLQSAAVYNSIGQKVWSTNYNGMGYTEMTVDLSNQAAGMYLVKLKYTDKTVVQRIMKQ
jgi:hypothetical protein